MSLIEVKKKLLMGKKASGPDISKLFATTLWTGNGAARTITTGLNHAAGSLNWIKTRIDNSGGFESNRFHWLTDTARPGYALVSNDTGGQQASSGVTALSNGLSLTNRSEVNFSGNTYACWSFFKAERLFDIVTYTGNGVSGRAVPHSLGSVPGMMLIKSITAVQNWIVFHRALGATNFMILNANNALGSSVALFNNTEPTDTVFSLGAGTAVNQSGISYVAYLFAHDPAADGVIQCGSYTGNGSSAFTNPQEIDLGWSAQYVLIKGASDSGSSSHWYIYDSARGLNSAPNNPALAANLAASETAYTAQVLSRPNGFAVGSAWANTSGVNYIYMAIRAAA